MPPRVAPFGFASPRATVKFTLAAAGVVSLHVFDVRGRLVTTLLEEEQRDAGEHQIVFEPRIASGVYFAQVIANGRMEAKRFVILK